MSSLSASWSFKNTCSGDERVDSAASLSPDLWPSTVEVSSIVATVLQPDDQDRARVGLRVAYLELVGEKATRLTPELGFVLRGDDSMVWCQNLPCRR